MINSHSFNYNLKMKIKDFLSKETKGFSLFEKIFYISVITFILLSSFLLNDNKIALISAICGFSYTFLAGKGKISCYFIGILGTFCYCYISFKNNFYGNLILYGLYFLPMQILGIFKWSKNLKKNTNEIVKTCLSKKEKIIYLLATIFFSIFTGLILLYLKDANPFIDSTTTTLSIIAQILTVKRCVEQWYLWLIVNILTLFMWIIAYLNGSNCFATIIMWGIYIFLAIYFLNNWKKELISNEENI